MSVLVSDLITNALTEIGDPSGQRISRAQALQFYNRTQLKIATMMRCLEKDVYFNVTALEPRYGYPASRVQVKAIRWAKNTTPASLEDYYWLDEKFMEEFRLATDYTRPVSPVWCYIARPNWFEVMGTPAEDVANGGIITMWTRPTTVVSEQEAELELPDFLEGEVQEGIQILARRAGRERVAAMEDWDKWLAGLQDLRPIIEDPSDDARASVRPHTRRYDGMR